MERGNTCPGDVTPQHNGESLGHRAPKGSSSLRSVMAPGLVLSVASVEHNFTEYAKQWNAKWLRIILVWLHLPQLDV